MLRPDLDRAVPRRIDIGDQKKGVRSTVKPVAFPPRGRSP
jgi:hypothetical protein